MDKTKNTKETKHHSKIETKERYEANQKQNPTSDALKTLATHACTTSYMYSDKSLENHHVKNDY